MKVKKIVVTVVALLVVFLPQNLFAEEKTKKFKISLAEDIYPMAISDGMVAVNSLFFLGFDRIETEMELNDSFLFRLTNVSLNWIFIYGSAVLSHELGHYQVARNYGYHTGVEFDWFSGKVFAYNSCQWENERWNYKDSIFGKKFISAGYNINELNSLNYFRNSAFGVIDYNSALGLFLNEIFLSRSLFQNVINPLKNNDNSQWIDIRKQQGKKALSIRTQLILSLTSDLLSFSGWWSLYTVLNYLFTGEKATDFPFWEIGNVKGTLPHLSLYRDENGFLLKNTLFFLIEDVLVESSLTFGINEMLPVRWSVDFRDIEIEKGLYISPGFAFTFAKKVGWGGKLEIKKNLEKDKLFIFGKISFFKNDLLGEIETENDEKFIIGFYFKM